ncbi:MAG: hypothetical protein DRP42_01535 [Tenericutes bacterium]|nr:MAG: hypothetical protein DRP42_01535 [Mycoplasmatota bacterium]
MALFRGWEVAYVNGTAIKEDEMEWKEIPKVGMTRVTLHYDGRRWDLVDKIAYVQKKRGSMVPGRPETFTVESRSIGYYEDTCKVWYTVDEKTGRMKMEVVDINVPNGATNT